MEKILAMARATVMLKSKTINTMVIANAILAILAGFGMVIPPYAAAVINVILTIALRMLTKQGLDEKLVVKV